ncbi:type IV toxin-antitoxin system AbiEi family antitoxin [Prauserella halophila]|nr:type IV toxin-antitoxin system AbiEi family antitoxin [Prauserella halophila]
MLLERRLPSSWSMSSERDLRVDAGRLDAVVELTGPDGAASRIAVESKLSLVRRDIPATLERIDRVVDRSDVDAVPMVIARYLSPPVRDELFERGVSYADATGNLLVQLNSPALFLRDTGADGDPWRGPGRPRGTLRGTPAARVVRTLVDFMPPMSVPEVSRRSRVSTGATYRVVELLEREALLEREERGPITVVRWRELLERWSSDYGFLRSNTVCTYLHPRGLSSVTSALAAHRDLRYAVTGSLAAAKLAPYAPARLAMMYADDLETVAAALGLRPVDSGANVMLATTDNDVVFDRTFESDGVSFVAPAQAAVDLLTGPGRSPNEASALLDWMEAHEPQWRH